ncbi:MAG TPA: hypothetical protein VLL52_06925, partial [Anaerolineae bacterium]|nr:hypothetical protein [Anaerolineae bacterium]
MTNFSKTTSHTLIGAFIGLLTSSLTYLLLTTSATTPTPTLLHILTLGLLTGFIYPLLFQPHPNHLLENALTGLVTSLLVWLIIGLNLLPLLTTGAPLWTTTAAVDTLPLLISAALHGTLTATLYGLIYTRFDLHPTPTIAEP